MEQSDAIAKNSRKLAVTIFDRGQIYKLTIFDKGADPIDLVAFLYGAANTINHIVEPL